MSRHCYLGRVGLSDSGVGIRIRCHKGVWTVRFAACSYSDHCHRTTASLLLLLLPRSVAIETAAAHDDDEQHALSKLNRLERPSTDSDLRPRAVRASCPPAYVRHRDLPFDNQSSHLINPYPCRSTYVNTPNRSISSGPT